MNIPTNCQIIEKNGKPMFVIIPYEDFLKLAVDEPSIPHEVVEKTIIGGASLIRAWREYLGYTQVELAEKIGVSQAALAQMEIPNAKHRKVTLQKIAKALGISPVQLKM